MRRLSEQETRRLSRLEIVARILATVALTWVVAVAVIIAWIHGGIGQ